MTRNEPMSTAAQGEVETLRVLLVKPGESAQVIDIEKGLKALQAAVGGHIQAVYPFKDSVALVCNDEGKLKGLPLNRVLQGENYAAHDIISGDFLVVGLGKEDFTSLPQDLLEKYSDLYKEPEYFLMTVEGIIVMKDVVEAQEDFEAKLDHAEKSKGALDERGQSHSFGQYSNEQTER